MRFLVVDDEALKRTKIRDYLRQRFENCAIDEARSFQGGVEKVLGTPYDFVVLDMRMTTYDVSGVDDGGRPRNFAGEETLRKMKRRKVITPVVILTQYTQFAERGAVVTFDELAGHLEATYETFKGMVHFAQGDDLWMTELDQLIPGKENEQ